MSVRDFADLVAILGNDSMPARAIKALHDKKVTPDEVNAWLRKHHLEGWKKTVHDFVHGYLFRAQSMGWTQWSSAYNDQARWVDKMRWAEAWHACSACGDENGPEWMEIDRFWRVRCSGSFTPEIIDKLKPDTRTRLMTTFHDNAKEYGWEWSK